jgi:hypothetical protein
MRRLYPHVAAVARLQQRFQRTAYQQRALNRVLRFPREEHLLNVECF